jgi:hypothetical protein
MTEVRIEVGYFVCRQGAELYFQGIVLGVLFPPGSLP